MEDYQDHIENQGVEDTSSIRSISPLPSQLDVDMQGFSPEPIPDNNTISSPTPTIQAAKALLSKPSTIPSHLQIKLDFDKIKLRIENEAYLRRHPEINDIMGYFVSSALEEHPEDVMLYATKLLSDGNLRYGHAAGVYGCREIIDRHKANEGILLGDPTMEG
jgi:hypothetical protein